MRNYVKLGSIANTFSGGTPSRAKPHYFGGTTPWIKSGEVNQRYVKTVSEFITDEGLQNSSAKVVQPGTILVAMYGATAGVIAVSRITAAINQAILAVNAREGVSQEYLFYALEYALEKTVKHVQGAQPNLSAEIIRASKIWLPIPETQQRIAAILDACDRTIDGTTLLLEKQEKRKKLLANKLLHPNSLNVPTGWAMHEVGDFVSALESGVSVNSTEDEKQGSSKKILKTSAVFNGEFYPERNKIITKADEQRAKLNPKAGSIIISRMNTVELVGQSGYVTQSHPDIFLPDRLWQTVFRDEHALSVKWLSYYLSSDRVRASIRNAASGTSGSMKNIGQESFLKIPVLTPPVEKQHVIARVLETVDKEINLLRKQHKLLQQQKKGLMQRLLTGHAFTR